MNLFLGGGIMVLCVVIQCLVVAVLVHWHSVLLRKALFKINILTASTLLCVVVLVLSFGAFLQISTWALLFLQLGEFADFNTAVYHLIVNFTTLGYGDLVMSEEHRLLGGLEAGNGILMLGLSTSVLYTALKFLINRGWHNMETEPAGPPGAKTGGASGKEDQS